MVTTRDQDDQDDAFPRELRDFTWRNGPRRLRARRRRDRLAKKRVSTSANDPLQIAEVPCANGTIGLTLCPGKRDDDGLTANWDRDMGADLDVVVNWGASAVVTLLEPREFGLLHVDELGAEVARRHMAWYHLPIKDLGAPSVAFERNWLKVGAELLDRLNVGEKVVVHCRGGRGRAGTIAVKLLVDAGEEPSAALRKVRAAREGAVETETQYRYVTSLLDLW